MAGATLSVPERGLKAALLALAAILGLVAGGHPTYAVAAAFGLAFIGIVASDLTLGLCLFTVVAFFDLLPTFGAALSFAKLAGLLLAASWAATVSTRERRGAGFIARHPTFAYALGLFLVWGALSYTWAETPSDVATPWSRYLLNAFLFLIVYAAVRERRHVLWVVIAFVAAAAASAAYSIVSPAAATLEDQLARATGTIGDANELAAVLVVSFVLAGAVAFAIRRGPLARAAALAAGAVCIYGVFLTLSRGGLIALGAALLAAVVFGGRWRPYAALAALLVALSVVGYFSLVATPDQRARVTTVENGSGRTDIWTVGWRMVAAHSLTGVGLGNFQSSSVHFLLRPGAVQRSDLIIDAPKVAHNTYLQVLSELGVVGLVLFLAILGFAVRCALLAARTFARRGDLRMELLTRGLLVALVGLFAADFFLSNEFSKQLWLLLGLCPALLAISRESSAGAPLRDEFGRRLRLAKAPAISAA